MGSGHGGAGFGPPAGGVNIDGYVAEATPDGAADYILMYDDSVSAHRKVLLNDLPTAGGGEINTGSNQGTDGVGVYDTKTGSDLQFRHVAPGSGKITVTLNGKDIDIDVGAVALADLSDGAAHKVYHQNGGADEISVAGLSGELADPQPVKTHASDHTDGTDDIQDATGSVKGLATAAQITKLNAIEALADVTDATNVAAAGAGMLATAQAWTKSQRGTEVVLTSTTGNIAVVASASNTYYHNIDEAAEVNNPSALAVGMRFSIRIEADGTNELTWGTYFDWGTGSAPDFSAMTDGDLTIVDCYVATSTFIMAAASDTYTP